MLMYFILFWRIRSLWIGWRLAWYCRTLIKSYPSWTCAFQTVEAVVCEHAFLNLLFVQVEWKVWAFLYIAAYCKTRGNERRTRPQQQRRNLVPWATPMMQTSTMLLPTFGFWMGASLRTQRMADQLTFLQKWGARSTELRPLRPSLHFSCITRLTRLCAHSWPLSLECRGIPPTRPKWTHFWRPKSKCKYHSFVWVVQV